MGTWTDRITNHRVMAQSEALTQAIAKARDLKFDDESAQEGLIRLSAAAVYIQAVLGGLNSYLTCPETLEGLAIHLERMVAFVNAFTTEKKGIHATQANQELDSALEFVAKILPKNPKAIFRGLPKVIQDANSRVVEQKTLVQRLKDNLATAEKSMTEGLFLFKIETEQELGSLKNSHRESIEEMQNLLSKRKTDFDNEWAALQNVLSAQNSSSIEALNKQWGIQDAHLDAFAETKQKDVGDKIKSATDLIEGLEKDMRTRFSALEAEVVKIVGATGNAAMAGEFQKIGLEEGGKADKFQTWANCTWLGFAIVGCLILIETFVHQWFGRPAFPGGWGSFASRLFVSLSVASLGGYLMRQADRHLAASRWAKRLSAEISSMGAFLAPLDEEQQKAVRVAVALSIFGQGSVNKDEQGQKSGDGSPPLPSIDGLSKVLGQVLDFTKTVK